MAANLIKSIRRSLGNEALEQRISELEARIAALEAQIRDTGWALRDARDALDEAARAYALLTQEPAPKKRKARAKTYGTE